jgi:hypothetical protein
MMMGIDLRTLLHAFAMASGAPPAAWEATDRPQAVADEAGENHTDLQCASGRKRDTDREVMLQHDIQYLRTPRLGYVMGR